MDPENFDIKIDESKHKEIPGIWDRTKTAILSVILAATLVQVFYFWGFFKGYSLGPGSVFFDFNNPIFLAYLGICGILGWLRGNVFTEMLNKELANWKFW